MKVYVLIDGGFLEHKFKQAVIPLSTDAIENVVFTGIRLFPDDQKINRIYYYDAQPLDIVQKKPVSKKNFNFTSTNTYKEKKYLLRKLKETDRFAVREGTVLFRGWRLHNKAYGKANLSDDDFIPDIQQKGVDIKIALDFSWLSRSKEADRIILIAGDSDFVPAIKEARRHGIQVALLTLGNKVSDHLRLNCDFLREHHISELLKKI